MNFFEKYKWRIISVAIGIIVVVLIFTINFWRTLLLLAMVGLAYFIGYLLDEGGRERIKQFFHQLFNKDA